jgi:hypothetical protein
MSRLTEIKRLKVDHACVVNPIYINWLGAKGERNYWLFHRVQTKGLDTTVGNTFSKVVNDNTNIESYIEEITRTAERY